VLFRPCEYSIETIPALPSKLNDPEDVDTDGEDHSYDALRYGVMKLFGGRVEEVTKKKGWRDKLHEKAEQGDYSGSWMSA